MEDIFFPSKDDINLFLSIGSIKDLASFIGIKVGYLEHFLFYADDETKYRSFEIKKRNGTIRVISSPKPKLKKIQRDLQLFFQALYPGKPSVHGFVPDRGIVSNAKKHVHKRYLVNIDLKDFFSTIRSDRVKAIFLSHPFYFNGEVANALTQICCFEGILPQGAPTSPVLSNFACRRLDNEFMKLARSSKVNYSRYADDIAISTNLKILPASIGEIVNNRIVLSGQVEKLISTSGFKINNEKVRFALRHNRQEVTGIIVNSKINVSRLFIREVRSMLHAWETFGISAAAKQHFELFTPISGFPENPEIRFKFKLAGKINHIGAVRGRSDALFVKLANRIKKQVPELRMAILKKEIDESDRPVILTEGKTDIKHFIAALKRFQDNGEYTDLFLKLHIHTDSDTFSDSELFKACQVHSKGIDRKNILICVFDRDVKDYVHKVTVQDQFFKSWGNKVYSMVIPVPSDREFHEICIEHLYTDAELTTVDNDGRRIFLSTEFSKETGKHLKENLYVKSLGKLSSKIPQIIDSGVFDSYNKSYALSKSDFADYVLNAESPYDSFNIDGFRKIFQHIQHIISLEKSISEQSLTNNNL